MRRESSHCRRVDSRVLETGIFAVALTQIACFCPPQQWPRSPFPIDPMRSARTSHPKIFLRRATRRPGWRELSLSCIRGAIFIQFHPTKTSRVRSRCRISGAPYTGRGAALKRMKTTSQFKSSSTTFEPTQPPGAALASGKSPTYPAGCMVYSKNSARHHHDNLPRQRSLPLLTAPFSIVLSTFYLPLRLHPGLL